MTGRESNRPPRKDKEGTGNCLPGGTNGTMGRLSRTAEPPFSTRKHLNHEALSVSFKINFQKGG